MCQYLKIVQSEQAKNNMSWLHRVFGTRDRPPTTDEAVTKLDEVLVRLEKRSDFLEIKIKEQMEIAKTNAKSNRRVALKALARKKRYDKELQSLDNTLTTVEYQRDSLGNAKAQTELFEAIRAGGRALQAAQNHLSLDDIEETQDQIDEQLQIAEEMRNALSRPLYGMDADTDEIEEELDQMMLDDELVDVGPVSGVASGTGLPDKPITPICMGTGPSRLPAVPTHQPGNKHKELSQGEEDELAELSQWATAN